MGTCRGITRTLLLMFSKLANIAYDVLHSKLIKTSASPGMNSTLGRCVLHPWLGAGMFFFLVIM